MPKGVEVVVENGFATIDFVDAAKRGPALAKLHKIGGPASVETITREGPRRQYRVPEGNARAAGLMGRRSRARPFSRGDSGFAEALRVAGLHPVVRAGQGV
jgi:hypothetical protein